MEGGDISNVITEGRTLVHARSFSLRLVTMYTALWGLIRIIGYDQRIDLVALANVVRACAVLPRPMLVTTDDDPQACEALYEELNSGYEHPFRGCACYESDQQLATLLAWMPNTRIIDVPGKAGVFGVRYLEIPWP